MRPRLGNFCERHLLRSKELFFVFGVLLLGVSCGTPGPPLPPSLELPQPVTDLRAARKGDAVTLAWTAPTLTTEGRVLTQNGSFEICRTPEAMQKCGSPIALVPFGKSPRGTSASRTETYVDVLVTLPTDATTNFYYAVSALNSYRKSAGLSNQIEVPAAPTLPAPLDIHAQVTAEGVRLTWDAAVNVPEYQNVKFVYRVYRREVGTSADMIAGELPLGEASPTLLDHGFEWEKTYDYWVAVATMIAEPSGEQQVPGDDSAAIRVNTHDVFPPAMPTGLQAVFSGPGQKPFIDLVWNANTEPDLAGYNIYRHEAGTEAQKINPELAKSPAYRDNNVEAGHQYTYSVSAVDVRGNESSRSEEANESVPAQ